MFWEMLVFQLNSTANCYRQPIFTISRFLFERPIFFLKKPEAWIFKDCYNFSRFYGKFAAFAILKDFSFSRKSEVFFNNSKSQNLNVSRNLTNSFKLYSKFVTISDFWKFQDFSKNPPFLQKIQLLNVLRNLTVPFAIDIKLANCFSCSRHQIG